MPKKYASAVILFFICLLMSCGGHPSNDSYESLPSTSASPAPAVQPSESPPEETDSIKERIALMSIDEKIGQMTIIGLEGTSLQPETEMMIENYHVGGFILYKDNITSTSQTVALLNQLKAANHMNKAPLWLSIDQEGGNVNRMPEDIKKLPTAQQVGKADDLNYTKQIALAIGEEVRALGFNMNFAPVLDINSNPKNPIIGSRSYGGHPDTVIKHGLETMKAMQSKQVAAVVKHFPGHGDTYVDSHLDLPVVKKTLIELESFELLPFIAAIKQGTDAMMIAHLLIPAVDELYPASLSEAVITDLLRNKLNYDGVIITDDMTMGGITKHYDIGEAAVKSVLAGTDIILIGHDHAQQEAVLQALQRSAESGLLSEDKLDRSVYRILQLKEKYELKDTAAAEADIQALNLHIQAALQQRP